MKYESKWKETRDLTVTESHLLIPMIWEGDLSIHSNLDRMKNSNFKNIIIHGDTSLSIAISLIELDIGKSLSYKKVNAKYKSFVCLNDQVTARYYMENNRVSFVMFKQNSVKILEGELLEIED